MEKANARFAKSREFLKDTVRFNIDFAQTAQSLKLPAPPLQKPCRQGAVTVKLPDGAAALAKTCNMSLAEAISRRVSVRAYAAESISLEELSAMLYATQGVRKTISPSTATRVVPSAGSRHAFETYVIVNMVEGLKKGVYRFLPFDNQLELIALDDDAAEKAAQACLGQIFVASAAFTLFWTVIPERMEWRYDLAAHKVLAIDAGHVCQNLYLATTAIGAGTCAIAAYDQNACDQLLGVDGEEEFTIYVAPVGRCR